jgi:hypothetical protein
MRKSILIPVFLLHCSLLISQVAVNYYSTISDSSAMLDVKSEAKGILIPRITYDQLNAIFDPTEGLIVFCIDCGSDGSLSVFSNGTWKTFSPCIIYSPNPNTNIQSPGHITWRWHEADQASGFKWNTINDYNLAIDIGFNTSETETGILCDSLYTRYVWSYNSCSSSNATMLTETIPPSAPDIPASATHVPSLDQIIWNWNTVVGAIGYMWNTTNELASATDMGTDTTITETGLTCGTYYTRYAWAYNGCGYSQPSLLTQVTDESIPYMPAEGIHVPLSIQIVWKWHIVTNATGYKWNTIDDYASATDMFTDTTKTEMGLTCNTAYIRYAWAYNICDNSAAVSLIESTSSAPATPGARTHVPSQTQIVWNWNTVTNAAGYKWNTVNDYASATDIFTDTTKIETGLTCNTAYIRYIWAYNVCGNSSSAVLNQSTLSCSWACGDSITKVHVAGNVAPVNKTVTYGTVTNIPGETSKCWITSNLGADHQATAVNDATEPSAGWYWQFNNQQGYKHDGTTRTPNTTWITSIVENSDWTTSNDPCSLELGGTWRIPTYTEWNNVDAVGGWTNWNGPWNSSLKIHAAGSLDKTNGSLYSRGAGGYYWSTSQYSTSNGRRFVFSSGSCFMDYNYKTYGESARCIQE